MGDQAPVKCWLGPPPPRQFTTLTRLLQAAVLGVMVTWIFACLGGLRLSPAPAAAGGNDTSQLFNWHPLLLTVAFPILMAEAVLAYKSPLIRVTERAQSKAWHFLLHTVALACVVLGVIAAFKSHTLKRPAPMANLYSSHSYLGLATLAALGLQYALAAAAYVWPKLPLAHRRALGPLHIYAGKAVFCAGLATMAVGIQEKQTFLQAYAKQPLYSAVMWLPGLLQLLLLLTAAAVLFHHAPPAGSGGSGTAHRWQQQPHEPDGDEAAVLVADTQLSEADELHTFDEHHSA